MATATVLTEGPALLFATLGSLLWIESASRPTATPSFLWLGIFGGLSIGIAVTCRQYYLALFPAAALVAVFQLRGRGPKEKTVSGAWHHALPGCRICTRDSPDDGMEGHFKPGMATGVSYNNWRAGVGLNAFRPIVASFYSCFYLLPLTFPVLWRMRPAASWPALLFASLGGIVAACLRSSLLQPGPLHALVRAASRLPAGDFILFGLIAGLTIYNAIAMGPLLWEKRDIVMSCPPLLFALLTAVFFVVEQLESGATSPSMIDIFFKSRRSWA